MVVVTLVLLGLIILAIGFLIRSVIALNGNVVDMHKTFKTFQISYADYEEKNNKLRQMNFEVIKKISEGL